MCTVPRYTYLRTRMLMMEKRKYISNAALCAVRFRSCWRPPKRRQLTETGRELVWDGGSAESPESSRAKSCKRERESCSDGGSLSIPAIGLPSAAVMGCIMHVVNISLIGRGVHAHVCAHLYLYSRRIISFILEVIKTGVFYGETRPARRGAERTRD